MSDDKVVNSIGTCQRCGYYGPGPWHDCPAVASLSDIAAFRAKLAEAERELAETIEDRRVSENARSELAKEAAEDERDLIHALKQLDKTLTERDAVRADLAAMTAERDALRAEVAEIERSETHQAWAEVKADLASMTAERDKIIAQRADDHRAVDEMKDELAAIKADRALLVEHHEHHHEHDADMGEKLKAAITAAREAEAELLAERDAMAASLQAFVDAIEIEDGEPVAVQWTAMRRALAIYAALAGKPDGGGGR